MKVYAFDTRDLIIWDILKNHFKLDNDQIYNAIEGVFKPMIERLKEIGVPYEKLKNVLTPQIDKMEICFVFDSLKIENTSYGSAIFKELIPLIGNIEKTAMFYGDLIGPNTREGQKAVREIMRQSIHFNTALNYKNSSQYFLVFFNNISSAKLAIIDRGLKNFSFYVGYFDITYSCYFKDIVSSSIGQKCLFYKKIAILPVSEDEEIDDSNPINYSFINYDKYGYKIRNIKGFAYSSFLSFKIQRSHHEFDNDDQIFSLHSVTKEPALIKGFDVKIDEEKYFYLMSDKLGSLKTIGLDAIDINQFRSIIRNNLNTNYIFNMEYNKNYECIKFNTVIDLFSEEKRRKKKYLISFQVNNLEKNIRLITMY